MPDIIAQGSHRSFADSLNFRPRPPLFQSGFKKSPHHEGIEPLILSMVKKDFLMEFQISWNDVRENKFHNLLGLRRIRKCRRLPF